MANKIYIDEKEFMVSTNSYPDLVGKPMVNSVPLEGNRTSEELGMYTKDEVDKLFASSRAVSVSETYPPLTPRPNTLYYCKRPNGLPMRVLLYDQDVNVIDLGDAESDMSAKQDSLPRVIDPDTGAVTYSIGRNVAGDGWEITAHSVEGAFKELDKNVQLRQKATDSAITVKDKNGKTQTNVVNALNALSVRCDDEDTAISKKADTSRVATIEAWKFPTYQGTAIKGTSGNFTGCRFIGNAGTPKSGFEITNISTERFLIILTRQSNAWLIYGGTWEKVALRIAGSGTIPNPTYDATNKKVVFEAGDSYYNLAVSAWILNG